MRDYNILVDDYLDNKINDPIELMNLYNNNIFMKLLLIRTRDSKYYNLCSYELKTNIDFVLFLTNIFNKDLNLLFSMINNYVYAVGEKDPKFPRLLYKIDGYLKYREFEFDTTYYMQYRCKIIDFFDKYQSRINSVLRKTDIETRKKHSLGFALIKNRFIDDDVIQEFFAVHFLNKIFYDYDFEDYIHINYNDKDILYSENEIEVLLRYINSYDVALYNYVSNKLFLLKEGILKLSEIKDNYDNYYIETKNKIDLFNTKLDEYLKEENIDMNYTVDLIKLEEIERLGLSKEFYGEELESLSFINRGSVIVLKMEKLRLFIRTELQNLFKNKTRKLEMSLYEDSFND